MSYVLPVGVLVSGKTILAAGLTSIAIVSLASIVVLQQITLQNILTRSSTTDQQYTTQRTESMLTSVQTSSTAYVMIYYSGSRIWENHPCDGCIWFGVVVVIGNHGYDRVPVGPSDFYVVIGTQQFAYSEKGQGIATGPNLLPETVLFNGNEAGGWIIYQLPYDGDFSILWNHPTDVLVYYQKSTSSTTLSPTK